MPNDIKRNSVFCVALAAFFNWGFMFAKHDAALRGVIPFGTDPYDAVGSFGIFVALVVAVIAMVRAFRRYPTPVSATQKLFAIRAQMVVVLVVLITLGADAAAMVRHPGMWIHSHAIAKLAPLLAAMVLAATGVQSLVNGSKRSQRSEPTRWTSVVITAILAFAALMLYPERLIAGVWTHLLTVLVGAVILFATTRALLLAIVPNVGIDPAPDISVRERPSGRTTRWAVVMLVGAAFGAFAFLGELSEGSSAQPIARLLAVAGVFLGLAVAGVGVAFGFLGAPLGLSGSPRQ